MTETAIYKVQRDITQKDPRVTVLVQSKLRVNLTSLLMSISRNVINYSSDL